MRAVRIEITPESEDLLDDLRKATLPPDKVIKSVSFEPVAGQPQIEIRLEISKKANIPLAAKWLYDLLDGRVKTLLVNRTEFTIEEDEIAKALEIRNIVLCSDGTGNAGGKKRGTNVWRLFNAIDWHHSDEQVEQIAFYNDGVGTDNMRLLRLLGGAFGLGLKDNIRTLYSVAGRNYRPGDRLYLFGFSRGAFTVRELAGMITTCGLPSQEALRDARNPRQLVRWMLRAYRGASLLIRPFLFVARKIAEARCKVTADTLRALKQMDEVRTKRKEQAELETKIKALQEKQNKLETRIQALQEKPDSRIEKINELCAEKEALETKAKKAKEAADKIEEEIAALEKQLSQPTNLLHCPVPIEFVGVWDTVDAVGIPNDEIRQVLRWVNERTSLLPRVWDFRDRDLSPHVARGVQALALDDERKTFHPNVWNRRTDVEDVEQVWFAGAHSNVGGGYPKDGMAYVTLDWMMGEAAASGLRFREKAREEVQANADVHGKLYDSRKGRGIFYRYAPRCLAAFDEKAGKCKIHSSVFERIRRGTAGYAPLTIPGDYEWVKTKIYSNDPGKPLSLPEGEQARLDYMTDLRKTLYAVFAWLSFFLVGVIGLVIVFPPAAGGGWLSPWLSQGVFKAILPWFLDPVVDLVDYHYLLTGAFLLPFLLLWRASHSRRVAIGSLASQAWSEVIDKWQAEASKSGKDDTSKVIHQDTPKVTKPGEDDRRKWDLWRGVSKAARRVTVSLFAIFLLSLIFTALPFFYGEVVPVSSSPPSRAATASSRCSNAQGPCALEPNGSILMFLDAKEKENRTGLLMEAGERYTVEYVSRTNWRDGEIDVSPGGFDFDRWLGVRRFWWLEWLRPYPQGHWYQVLGRIGDNSPAFPLFREDLSGPEEFKPLESGELYLFVNDLPYWNNSGTMTLRITRPE